MRKHLFFITLLSIIIYSCSQDDNETIIIEFTDFNASIDENPVLDQVIGSINATTNIGNISFELISQSPENSITIDTDTGEVSVLNPDSFDFETNQTIEGTVKIINGTSYEEAQVLIEITNVVELTNNDFQFTIDENPENGDIIGNVVGDNVEDNITYSLVSQNPQGGLIINPETGDLTVNNNTLFDFETNPVFNAVYAVSVNGSFLEGNINIQLNNVVSSAFVIAGNCPSVSISLSSTFLAETVDVNQDGQPDLEIYYSSFNNNTADLLLRVTTLNSNVEITKSEDYKNVVLSELQNPVFDHPAWQGDSVYIHNAANVNWTDKFNEGDVIDTNNDWSGGEFYFNIQNKRDAAGQVNLPITTYNYNNSLPYVGLRIVTNNGVKYGWINYTYGELEATETPISMEICFDNE